MPALQVRDFPQGLYDKLKLEAEAEHRSLSQQTVAIIEQHFNGPREPAASLRLIDDEAERKARIARRERVFAEIEALPKFAVPDDFPSIVEIIHEGREENDGRLGC